MSLLLPYTLVSLVLDFTQMVLAVRKHLEMDIKIHSLGKSLLLPYTLMSLVLDFTQMVLAVLKTLKWPL